MSKKIKIKNIKIIIMNVAINRDDHNIFITLTLNQKIKKFILNYNNRGISMKASKKYKGK